MVWLSAPQAMLSHLSYLVIHFSKLVLFSMEDVVLVHSPGLKLAAIVAIAAAMAWRGWLWRCALVVQSAAHLCLVLWHHLNYHFCLTGHCVHTDPHRRHCK